LASKVALVEVNGDTQTALNKALTLIGEMNDLNTAKKPVVVKVGVFNHKGP